jgi:hypothetical protein
VRLQELNSLAEKGLHLFAVTKDPLTFSAASLLLQAKSARLTESQQNAVKLLTRQLEAYKTIFPNPLV